MEPRHTELHIAGVLVRCRPSHLEGVLTALGQRPGVEVHQVTPDSGLVVATVETAALDQQVTVTKALLEIQGVMDVDLVYHAFDQLPVATEGCAL